MKITYLKLENFIGIYAGTLKKSIEIDFTKNNKNKIIMLLGKNGAGKSVILSALTPLRGTNDERNSNFIIEDENGYKEIHIVNGKDKYVIKHFYGNNSSKNKSFISKNGKELNENGGIKTFNTIVSSELDIDDDYLKVGRIGSNVTNFIDLKTAERKKFINKFIPNIDDYLAAFETVKNKFSDMDKQLKLLTIQLSKYRDYDTIKYEKEQSEKFIKKSKDDYEEYNKLVIERNNTISNIKDKIAKSKLISEDITVSDYISQIYNRIKTCKSSLDTVNYELTTYYNKYKNLSNYDMEKVLESFNECEKEIALINNDIKHYNDKLQSLKENLVKLYNDKESLEARNNSFENVPIDELNDELKKISENIKNTEKILSGKSNIIIDDCKDDNEMYYNLLNTLSLLTDIRSSALLDENLQEFDENVDYQSVINNLDNEFKKLSSAEQSNNSMIDNIKSRMNLLDLLDKRPGGCYIDECPFIKSSCEFKKNELPLISKYEKENEKLLKSIEETNRMMDYNEVFLSLKESSNNFNQIINGKYGKYIRYIIGDIMDEITFKNFVNTDSMRISDAFSLKNEKEFITAYKNKEIDIERFNSLKIQIKSEESNLKNIEEIKNNFENICNDIESTRNQIKEIKGSIDDMQNKEHKLKLKADVLNNTKEYFIQINELESELKELNDFKNTFENDIAEIDELNAESLNYQLIASDAKTRLNKEEKNFNELSREIILIENTLEKIDSINNEYDCIKLVKESLDPKSGIPLIFIDNYLKDIAQRTNELLAIAYNGRFKISFEISSTDFYIHVIKDDGTVLNDIGEASQGETSLTNISLSLAMIEKMMGKYNILYLDEIDSTLSTENRRMFIKLLENQIDNLNIEQVFLISHNNEFQSYPIDMILLKDNDADINNPDFMQGKHIIFDINQN